MSVLKDLAALFCQDFDIVFANSEDVVGDILSSFDCESMRALIGELDDLLERSDGQIQAIWESSGSEIRIEPTRNLRVLLEAIRERATLEIKAADRVDGSKTGDL